jgi:hypothetical protein
MKRKTVFKFLLPACFFSGIFFSCTEIDLTNISKDIAIDESLITPVGEASLTANDLLVKLGQQDYLDTIGNEIYFTSEENLSYRFRDIDLNKYSQGRTVVLKPWSGAPGFVFLPSGTTIPTVTTNDSVSLGLNSSSSERIVKAEIASANVGLNITLTNDIKNAITPANLNLKIEFPGNAVTLADGVTPLVINTTPNVYGTVKNIPLANFIMNTPAGATGIPVKVTVNAKTTSAATASSSSSFTCNLTFNQISFKVLWGHFEPDTYAKDSLSVPIDLHLPTSFSGLNLKFANPTAKVTINTNIGANLRFNVDEVKAFDKNNVQIAKAFFTGPDAYNGGDSRTFHLAKPTFPGDWLTTIITLDKDNGATDRLFAAGKIPSLLEYKFSSGLDPDPLSFIVPNSLIKANVKISIPLLLNGGSSVEFNDSIKNIGTSLTSDLKDVTINNATIVLSVTNGFPVPATLELVNLVDANGQALLKDLQTKYSIEAPTVNATDGSVTATHTQQLKIVLTPGQEADFKKLKDLHFRIVLGDPASTNPMHFSKTNFLKVKAGVFAKGTLTGTIGTSK